MKQKNKKKTWQSKIFFVYLLYKLRLYEKLHRNSVRRELQQVLRSY